MFFIKCKKGLNWCSFTSVIESKMHFLFKAWVLFLLPYRIWRNGSFLSSGWRLHNLFRADEPRCQNYPSHWCISQSLRLEKKLQRCSPRPNFFHSRWTWFSLCSSKLFRTQKTSRSRGSQRNEIWLFSLPGYISSHLSRLRHPPKTFTYSNWSANWFLTWLVLWI